MSMFPISIPLRFGTTAILSAALVLGALTGGAVSVALNGGLPDIRHSPSNPLVTLDTAVTPSAGTPLATRRSEGFEVSLLGDGIQGDQRVVSYAVGLPPTRFADMLGIPRIVNPDGSFALPSEYGAVPADQAAGRPGLADGATSVALFASDIVQPGAVLRFGPFFEALDQGTTITATVDELTRGLAVTIGGEPFKVFLSTVEAGVHEVRFVPTSALSQIVASHPASRVTATVDGRPLRDLKGSTNFAKTEDLDVNANQSAVVVGGEIPEGANVSITIDSIGRVVKGAWDFPLD
jgi:hypothetical protein